MKTSSAKQKGRRLCQDVKDKLITWAPDLHPDDILVASAGTNGEDLVLSPRARMYYNYAIECKNVEKLNVWDSYKQAVSHIKDDRTPLLIFSRNRSDVMVCLTFENFLKLTR